MPRLAGANRRALRGEASLIERHIPLTALPDGRRRSSPGEGNNPPPGTFRSQSNRGFSKAASLRKRTYSIAAGNREQLRLTPSWKIVIDTVAGKTSPVGFALLTHTRTENRD